LVSAVVSDAWRTLRPGDDDEDGPLVPLLVGMTMVTGVVDAVSYLSLGHVFVANMTGNVVFLAFALAGARGFSIVASALALVVFAAGALLGGRMASGFGGRRHRLLLAATALEWLLAAAAEVVALTGASGSAARDGLIALLAMAMGVQNATARKLAVPDLTTTVLTLTITGITADSRWAGGTGSKAGRRLVSVLAMFGGAAVGAVLFLDVGRGAALGTALALLALIVVRAETLARPGRSAKARPASAS
jgi:uncharacterized membrane protein YoaK (UPF0700 family)